MRPDIVAGPIERKYSESKRVAAAGSGWLLAADGERRGRHRGGQAPPRERSGESASSRNCLHTRITRTNAHGLHGTRISQDANSRSRGFYESDGGKQLFQKSRRIPCVPS